MKKLIDNVSVFGNKRNQLLGVSEVKADNTIGFQIRCKFSYLDIQEVRELYKYLGEQLEAVK